MQDFTYRHKRLIDRLLSQSSVSELRNEMPEKFIKNILLADIQISVEVSEVGERYDG